MPKGIELSCFENHIHSPYEHLQLLRAIEKDILSVFSEEDLIDYLSLTDEVFLRTGGDPLAAIKRYHQSAINIYKSDVIILEFSSLKNIISTDVSLHGRPVNVNITCNGILEKMKSHLHVNQKPSLIAAQSAVNLIQKIVGAQIFSGKKFILVPHFQYKASDGITNKDTDSPGDRGKWIQSRQILRKCIYSATEILDPDLSRIKIFDPSALNESLPAKDLFIDSAHYNKSRLHTVAMKISEFAAQLCGESFADQNAATLQQVNKAPDRQDIKRFVLAAELTQIQSERDSANQENSLLQKANADLRQQLKSLAAELTQIQSERDSTNQENSLLQKANADLRQQLKSLAAELTQIQSERDSANQENSLLQKANADLRQQLKSQNAVISQLEEKYGSVEKGLLRLRKLTGGNS